MVTKETAIIAPMRRLLVLVSIFLLACQAVSSLPEAILASPATFPTNTLQIPTATPFSTQVPTRSPPPVTPTTTQPKDSFTVRLHPDGPLYTGDLVSIEIIAPNEADLEESKVQVQVSNSSTPIDLGTADFNPYGIGGRLQATLTWVWDTRGLAAGAYPLNISILPDGLSWTETVRLFPRDDLPPPEPGAKWETAENECCLVHYITGTEAADDLPSLLASADEVALDAVESMGIGFSDPIPITVLPRVLGHGGFAASEIYISYLGQNYAGNDFSQVLHHEMIHLLDSRLAGDLRPALLVEGLAVYLSGGHFKREPLLPRAAALVDLGWYLPLAPLADAFYTSQHEIGYLEGGALVQYMVNTFGWKAFDTFYRDIHPHSSGKQSQAIDAALQTHFGLTLAQLEARFLASLHHQQINPDMYDDIHLSVYYYDTVRRYQQLLDPSAYFLTAWLPAAEQMRERGIVADYLRHPENPENVALEAMLVEADRDLRAGNYVEVGKTLSQINTALDELE